MLRRLTLATALVALSGGCESEDQAPLPALQAVPLAPAEQLVRASMALRGIRPSLDELEEVSADPAALETIVDGYLASDELGKVMRDLHNEALLLRTDYYYYPAGFLPIAALEGVDPYYLNRSLEEAPLRLVEHVIQSDRPYTEIVTADYAVANAIGATVWGQLAYDPDGPEWQVLEWGDGRGGAGVLSDPWVLTRYQSTLSNANRGRANAISKALLCYDFLSRDIEIDASIDLADPDVVANAVRDNDACASCHQTLDPLAGFFKDVFPIYVPAMITDYDFAGTGEPYPLSFFYYPDVSELAGMTLREPGYFGQSGESLADLGHFIAGDPRFSLCAAKRFYAYFHQTSIDEVPLAEAARFQSVLTDSGFDAKALAKAIVLDPGFFASHALDEATALELRGMKKVRADQLATLIEDLTGFVWETDLSDFGLGRVELIGDSFLGYQVMGGGIDAQFVTQPAHTYSASSSLVLQAAAAEAASFVTASDFSLPASDRRLLRLVEADDEAEPAIRAQLAWLHGRLYGELVAPESAEVDESWTLFAGVLKHAKDPERAWEATLTAMLQDLRIAYY